MTESGWVEQELGRPVIKAFNTIIAENLLTKGRPSGAADRVALAIAGDDPRAKAIMTLPFALMLGQLTRPTRFGRRSRCRRCLRVSASRRVGGVGVEFEQDRGGFDILE
jgi:hypothetical protein